MKYWMTPALSILSLATMTSLAGAQGADRMAKPMSHEMTYTGCIAAGPTAGTFSLTQIVADMGKDAMGKDAMAKGEMKRDTMGKDAMAKDAMGKESMPTMLTLESKSVDLSKHVGHKVAATGSESSMGMAKPSGMEKSTPAFAVSSLTMIAASCGM